MVTGAYYESGLYLTLEALREEGQIDPPPPQFFDFKIFVPWPIVKSFGTTIFLFVNASFDTN